MWIECGKHQAHSLIYNDDSGIDSAQSDDDICYSVTCANYSNLSSDEDNTLLQSESYIVSNTPFVNKKKSDTDKSQNMGVLEKNHTALKTKCADYIVNQIKSDIEMIQNDVIQQKESIFTSSEDRKEDTFISDPQIKTKELRNKSKVDITECDAMMQNTVRHIPFENQKKSDIDKTQKRDENEKQISALKTNCAAKIANRIKSDTDKIKNWENFNSEKDQNENDSDTQKTVPKSINSSVSSDCDDDRNDDNGANESINWERDSDSEDEEDNDADDENDTDNESVNEENTQKKQKIPGFNYLHFMYTNADGLTNKMDDLKERIAEESPDIVSVVETHMQLDPTNQKYYPTEALEIQGYTLYRKDNPDEIRGGILVYVADHIPVTIDTEINNMAAEFKESLWLVLQVKHEKVLCGSVYRKGSSKAVNNTMLRNVINRAAKKYEKFLLCGDFNHPEVDWINGSVDGGTYSPAMRFRDCLMDNYLQQNVLSFTRRRGTDEPSLLDLVITEDTQTQAKTSMRITEPLGKSDHSTLTWRYLVSTSNDDELVEKPSLKPQRNYKKADYTQMKSLLDEINWETSFKDKNIDECVEEFYRTVEEVSDKCIPWKVPSKWHNRPPWMSKAARKTVRKKRCAWRRYQQSKSYQQYLQYVKQRNATAKKVKKAKRDFERKLAKECKKNPKCLFKYANFKNKTKNNVIRLKDEHGNIRLNDEDNADILNTFFKSVFTDENDAGELAMNEASGLLWGEQSPEPFNYSYKPVSDPLTNITITQDMILEELERLDPNKTNIKDCVSPIILKEVGNHLLEPLEYIFNLSLQSETVPTHWKKATITALYKGEDRHEAKNYRPVSITSQLCRIMERILKKVVMKHLEENNIIADEQHGFVSNRSCLSNLLLNLETITDSYDQGIPVDQVFLDLQKAFDKVPHQRLLYKINKMGISDKIYGWIKSFLEDRYQRVSVNQAYSKWTRVKSGVPQGSVLGPLLFIMYINDMPNNIGACCSIFADDTKISKNVSTHEDALKLQEDLEKLEDWTDIWKLTFNAEKCKIIHFGSKNKHYDYLMKGQQLKKVETEKDLGAIVSYDLKVGPNIVHHVAKANKMVGLIRRTFSFLNKDMFLALYKAYIRPHLEYCQQAFYPHLEKDIALLEGVQRRATKLVQSIEDLPYPERLKELDLYTLEQRRNRGDMITVFKIIKGIMKVDMSKLFNFADYKRTRGHQYKLKTPKTCNTNIRQKFFSQRVLLPWNKLPHSIINSENVEMFKREYDKVHKLKTNKF